MCIRHLWPAAYVQRWAAQPACQPTRLRASLQHGAGGPLVKSDKNLAQLLPELAGHLRAANLTGP